MHPGRQVGGRSGRMKSFVHPFVHQLNPYFAVISAEQDESGLFFFKWLGQSVAEWKTVPPPVPLPVSLFRSNEFGGMAESTHVVTPSISRHGLTSPLWKSRRTSTAFDRPHLERH